MFRRKEKIQEIMFPQIRRDLVDWVSVLIFGELAESIMAFLVFEAVDTHSISIFSEVEDSVSGDVEELEHEGRVVIKPLRFRSVLVINFLKKFDPVEDSDEVSRFRTGDLLETLPEGFHGLASVRGLDGICTIDFTDFLKYLGEINEFIY